MLLLERRCKVLQPLEFKILKEGAGIKFLACYLLLMGAKSICPVHFDVFNFLPPVLMVNCNISTCK